MLDFEGETDPEKGASKRRAALLTAGGQTLREIFSTLTVAGDTYKAVKDALTAHFFFSGSLQILWITNTPQGKAPDTFI